MDSLELLKKLISIRSITPNEGGIYNIIKEYLEDFHFIEQEIEGVKNLFAYKVFGEGKHLCFGGHVDVVPPGEGWSYDPFTPTEAEGYIYGRGTQDMKSGVVASLVALKNAKNFSGTLSILLTSDEEGDGVYGTREMLLELKRRDMLPHFVVVAEPTCERDFGDAIKIGRRGSINGVLKIKGKQGHAAYPDKTVNPVEIFAPFLEEFSKHRFDSGGDGFEPSRVVVTDIRGGMEVTNVTPAELKVMFNVRNSIKTKKEDIENYIVSLLKDVDFDLKLTEGSSPFLTDSSSLIVERLLESIRNITGKKAKLSTAGGTSDARYFGGEFGIPTVEFGVINDRIHAIDERVTIIELQNLCKIFDMLVSDQYNWVK